MYMARHSVVKYTYMLILFFRLLVGDGLLKCGGLRKSRTPGTSRVREQNERRLGRREILFQLFGHEVDFGNLSPAFQRGGRPSRCFSGSRRPLSVSSILNGVVAHR